jgi:hypothetical protein
VDSGQWSVVSEQWSVWWCVNVMVAVKQFS